MWEINEPVLIVPSTQPCFALTGRAVLKTRFRTGGYFSFSKAHALSSLTLWGSGLLPNSHVLRTELGPAAPGNEARVPRAAATLFNKESLRVRL